MFPVFKFLLLLLGLHPDVEEDQSPASSVRPSSTLFGTVRTCGNERLDNILYRVELKYQYSKLQVPRMILYIPGSEKLLIPGLHLQGMWTTWNDPTTLCFTPDILLWCRDTENHSRNLDWNLSFPPTCNTTEAVQVLTRRQSTRWWRGRGTPASSSSVRLTRLFSPAGLDTCQPISCSS